MESLQSIGHDIWDEKSNLWTKFGSMNSLYSIVNRKQGL